MQTYNIIVNSGILMLPSSSGFMYHIHIRKKLLNFEEKIVSKVKNIVILSAIQLTAKLGNVST